MFPPIRGDVVIVADGLVLKYWFTFVNPCLWCEHAVDMNLIVTSFLWLFTRTFTPASLNKTSLDKLPSYTVLVTA